MSSPARLVLGVDAGGTKTDAALADATTGEVVTTIRLGAANHEGIGWAAAADTMRTAVTTVCAAADVPATAITASAWGLSGLDWAEDGTRYREIVDSLGLAGPALVVNDAFLCLELAPAGPAVAVVAGTGVVAVARDGAGRTARTLGVGAGHGEWGSGGDVVRAAVEAVAQAYLDLGPATSLTAAALAASGAADVGEFCRLVWREHRPSLTPADVWDVAARGDEPASAIATRAADSYAAAAASLVRRLDLVPATQGAGGGPGPRPRPRPPARRPPGGVRRPPARGSRTTSGRRPRARRRAGSCATRQKPSFLSCLGSRCQSLAILTWRSR